MKSFQLVAAQGEITVFRVGGVPAKKKLPDGYKALRPENGRFIIGHSESGHHHVIAAKGAIVGELERPPEGMRILRAILADANSLDHLRDHDTHESIRHEPGEYLYRIGREYDPYEEIARRQAD